MPENKTYLSKPEILRIITHIYNVLHKKQNVIITGSKGSGKSYLVNMLKEYLAKENLTFTSIETKAIRDTELYPKEVHIYSIDIAGKKHQHNIVAIRNENGIGLTPNPEVFNIEGAKMLKESTATDILIIDEIGFLEESAEIYKAEIRKAITIKPSVLVLAKRDSLFIAELMGAGYTVIDIDCC